MNEPAVSGPLSLSTANGLAVEIENGGIRALCLDGEPLAGNGPTGFAVVDQADPARRRQIFSPMEPAGDNPLLYRGISREAGLGIEARFTATPSCIVVDGRVTNLRGGDRALALSFSIPVDAAGWTWDDDIRRSRPIGATGCYERTEAAACGSGRISVYPVAAVHDARRGLALALDPARPAQFQLVYDADRRCLSLNLDLALVPESEPFPNAASFAFRFYPCDPRWGFRSAFDTYMRLFADAYAVRSRDQGIWMPFSLISKIEHWQDFGFRYHEGGAPDHAFDRQHGILPFHYTEPFTWWMPMPDEMPRTYEAARTEQQRILREGSGRGREMAAAMEASAMTDADGRWVVSFHKLPWCNGACWALNPNPAQTAQPNGASVNWNPALCEARHGSGSLLAGEYIDSVEGYTTPELNFRRDNFRWATAPLTYDPATLKPGLFKGLAVYEYARRLSEDMHRRGKLLFGNGVPYRFSWLAPLFDIMGTESVWLDEQDRYAPPPDCQMALWRTLSGRKPYLLLQNTRFKAFDPSMVERYLQYCLFYGLYPSMFSVDAASDPYWADPTLYNRDRDCFRKYQPLIREVGEAGWQPVTRVRSDNPDLYVERFGDGMGTVLVTLFNPGLEPQRGTLAFELSLGATAAERVTGATLARDADGRLAVEVPPQSARVLAFTAG